jgi:mRNA interferase MazF
MAANEQTPPKIEPRITAAPKIRQIYWCDFPLDAHLPEFWKTRPVVILSYRNTLYGAVSVIPCSTGDQTGNPWAVPMQTTIDGRASWAICDKLSTVAVSRLSVDRRGIAKMPADEFDAIVRRVLEWLPTPA